MIWQVPLCSPTAHLLDCAQSCAHHSNLPFAWLDLPCTRRKIKSTCNSCFFPLQSHSNVWFVQSFGMKEISCDSTSQFTRECRLCVEVGFGFVCQKSMDALSKHRSHAAASMALYGYLDTTVKAPHTLLNRLHSKIDWPQLAQHNRHDVYLCHPVVLNNRLWNSIPIETNYKFNVRWCNILDVNGDVTKFCLVHEGNEVFTLGDYWSSPLLWNFYNCVPEVWILLALRALLLVHCLHTALASLNHEVDVWIPWRWARLHSKWSVWAEWTGVDMRVWNLRDVKDQGLFFSKNIWCCGNVRFCERKLKCVHWFQHNISDSWVPL